MTKPINSIPQPNRMIRLFQNKGDLAFAKYLVERSQSSNYQIDSPSWQASVHRATRFEVESTTWFKAADLLRKEELNK